ncbi:amidohydrolase family protein [Isobaculum melis]|uniref:Amidohydrolase-related domain-containing protein n=1 Tax=Isobaculum melis TaxID=142588 RepID=A0A1H9T249_9LACT|nr:amidohydrolase family protein [Isobaculum melis]SER91074.1 hypothetical protein SAMN04488559_11061 [Isobaculum melis]
MYIDIHSHITFAQNRYHIDELLEDMNENQIDKRVISSINNEDLLLNNRSMNDLCAQYPDRLIGCSMINPKCKNVMEQIKEAIELPYIQFLEFDSFEHGYYPELQENLFEIFDLVKETNLIVKVFVGIGARTIPQQWEKYAQAFPTIKFIFLHMGCFDYGYTCIDVAQRNDNIYVETSNQYELQILRKALKELKIDKIVFGTKYPERLTSSSIYLFDMLTITEEEKAKIFYKNSQNLMNEDCR